MAVMLCATREAETGPSMLYHPTAATKVAQGPHSPSSIPVSHVKLLAQGHKRFGLWLHGNRCKGHFPHPAPHGQVHVMHKH